MMNKRDLSEKETKSMLENESLVSLEEILAEPLEMFTAEELQISPALAERSRAAALQAYYLAKMRDIYHPSFAPLSLREFVIKLAQEAGVAWQELLSWWGVERWLSLASASLALTELAKAIGVSAEKVELHLRIGLAQEFLGEDWETGLVKWANGPDEQQRLKQCNDELRKLESGYSDEYTSVLQQLTATVHQVYRESRRG